MEEYNLGQDKNIVGVTDNGSNMIKSFQYLTFKRLPCIAHGLHNLITVDLFENGGNSVPDLHVLSQLIKKMREGHRALIYKYSDLKDEFEKSRDEKIMELLETHSDIGMYYRL